MNAPYPALAPQIIPRSEHTISRSDISPNALKVLYRLKEAGYQAFLVGGAVRDLLLGIRPKDFDVATNALPEEVRHVFRNCRLVGRRTRDRRWGRVGGDPELCYEIAMWAFPAAASFPLFFEGSAEANYTGPIEGGDPDAAGRLSAPSATLKPPCG